MILRYIIIVIFTYLKKKTCIYDFLLTFLLHSSLLLSFLPSFPLHSSLLPSLPVHSSPYIPLTFFPSSFPSHSSLVPLTFFSPSFPSLPYFPIHSFLLPSPYSPLHSPSSRSGLSLKGDLRQVQAHLNTHCIRLPSASRTNNTRD